MSDLTIAVDVGTSKVACVAAGIDKKGNLEVVSLAYGASAGVSRGMIQDVEAVSHAVNEVVGKVERHLSVSITNVWCGIGGAHLESASGQGITEISPPGRLIKRQDLHHVVNHSRQMLLPADREQVLAVPREYVVDGQRGISDPIGLKGSRFEVVSHIITGSSSEVDRMEEVISGSERRVMGMIPTALASGLGVLSQDAMELGAVVLDIGAGKTDVAVFSEGVLAYQGCVRIGADHFSQDICQLLKTDFDEAERLVMEFGSANSQLISPDETVNVTQYDQVGPRPMKRKMLSEILESRAKEIFQHVDSKLDESGLRSRAKQLVLTGGGADLAGITNCAEEVLGFSQVRGVFPKVTGPFVRQVASPNLSTVVGIARYAMESGEDDLAPVSGVSSWKDRISTLKKSLGFGKKG